MTATASLLGLESSETALARLNTSWTDRWVVGHIVRGEYGLRTISKILVSCKEPRQVLIRGFVLNQYPLRVRFKSIGWRTVKSRDLLTQVLALIEAERSRRVSSSGCRVGAILEFRDDYVLFEFSVRARLHRVSLAGLTVGGDIPGVYVADEYGWLNPRDRTVVDIGASIGDSAVYFGLRGAREVLAFEPFGPPIAAAKRNIIDNGLQSVVRPYQTAVGGSSGAALVNPADAGVGASLFANAPSGQEVKVTTLEEITRDHGVTDGILKMDCEGSEYSIVSATPVSALRAYVQMVIEYHYGHRVLRKQLADAGFHVTVSHPFRDTRTRNGLPQYRGLLFAERR